MKWFKHFSDAHDDEKLSEALCIHGAGAYGVFWLIVEAVAAQMDKTDRCSARYHYKKWATIAHVDRRTLTRYLQTFNILTLIVSQECDNFVTIEIPKLLLLRDNYTKDLQASTRKTSKQEVEVEVEKKEPKPKKPVFDLPIWINQEAWDGFVEMRKKIKAPLTDRAMNLAVKNLERLAGDPNDIINQSTQNCWKGLFEVKTDLNSNKSTPKTFNQQKTDNTKAAITAFVTGGNNGTPGLSRICSEDG